MPARTSHRLARGPLLTPRRLATLPGKGTGLIEAVYPDIINTKTNNFCLSLGKKLSGMADILSVVLPEWGS